MILRFSGKHSAGGIDIFATRSADCSHYTLLVQIISKHDHTLIAGGMEVHTLDGMEAYQVNSAVDLADQLYEHIGMRHIVVDAAPHDIFQRQATLMAEVVGGQTFHHRRDGESLLRRHQRLALSHIGSVDTHCHMHLRIVE